MNWRRLVRFGAAAGGVGCAVALYVSFRPREVPPPPPAPPAKIDPGARGQWFNGKMFGGKAGREIELYYETMRDYPDGRGVFEKTHVVFQGGRYELWADVIETKGASRPGVMPSVFDLKGNVRFVGKDGLSLHVAAATYDDETGLVTMPGPLTFTRGRLTGRSVGGTYHRDEERIRLNDQAAASIAADEKGSGATELTSTAMVMLPAQHAIHLEGAARITTARQILAGDNAVIVFTDDEQAMKFLELRGKAAVTPEPAPGERTTDMQGDNITLAFHPDGNSLQHATLTGQARLGIVDDAGRRQITGSWVDVYLAADGRTLTRLDARDRVVVELPSSKDAPARTIRSNTLQTRGDERKGLQQAIFDGDVTFEENEAGGRGRAASTRTGQSRTLVLQLAGDLEAVTDVEFRRSFSFIDGTAKARAESGRYDQRAGVLSLAPDAADPKRLPSVEDDGFVLIGRAVTMTTKASEKSKAHDLHARGSVTTRMLPKQGGTRRAASLFDDSKEISGAAEEVIYSSAQRQATYTGSAASPAVLFQDRNRVEGLRLTLDETSGNLTASGAVNASFVATPDDPAKKPVTHQITADTLTFDDARRHATYTGAPVTLKNDDVTIDAERLEMTLGEGGRAITRLVATAKVFGVLKDGSEFDGQSLNYDAASGEYVIVGTPARAKSPRGKDRSCYLQIASRILFTHAGGSFNASGALTASREVTCATSLRDIR